MRFFIGCFLLLFASVATAGDYGTLTAAYAGRDPAHSMGQGGRFDWNPVALSPNSSWDPAWQLQTTGGTLYSFCIELAETVGSTVFDVNALTNAPNNPGAMTAAEALAVEKLADAYFALSATGTAVQAGAFQYALWEIIHGDSNVATMINGSFWGISAAARTLAGTYLASLGSLTDKPETISLALVNNGRQDQLIQVAVVPEFTSIVVWTMFAGMAGCVLHRRRLAIG